MEYAIIYRISLKHDYFQEDGFCRGVELIPASDTLALLKRRGVLFRKENVSMWVLIAMGEKPFTDEDKLYFTLKIKDPAFTCFTKEEEEYTELLRGNPMIVSISDQVLEKTLFFHAKELYWEYIFISGREGKLSLFLEDVSKNIDFDLTEKNVFMDHKAYRFLSRQKVKLQEYYSYNLNLSEATSYGNKLLMRNIAYPCPGRILCTDPERIQTIVYI